MQLDFEGTCSIDNPKDRCLTYVTDTKMLSRVNGFKGKLTILIPEHSVIPDDIDVRFELIESTDPFLAFVNWHNRINYMKTPRQPSISLSDVFIHPTASIGNEGMRYIRVDDKVVSVKHMGDIIIADGVTVGAHSSIARAVFDSTVIGSYVKIGSGCQIGHNCQIGARTIIIDGAIILGSVKIGCDCYIGGGSVVRNGVVISDQTLVGMGAVVSKDIKKSNGVHYGNPAKYVDEWNGVWP